MEKKNPVVHECGICPYCGSDDVEYGSMEMDCGSLSYEMHCNKCGEDSKEWYSVEYSETIGDK